MIRKRRQATRLSSSTQSRTKTTRPTGATSARQSPASWTFANERDAGRHPGDGGARSVAPRVRRGRDHGSYAARSSRASTADDHVAEGPPHDPCAVRRARSGIRRSLPSWATTARAARSSSWAAAAKRTETARFACAGRTRARCRFFNEVIEALDELGVDSGIVGEVQSNPIWQLLPTEIQFLFDEGGVPCSRSTRSADARWATRRSSSGQTG